MTSLSQTDWVKLQPDLASLKTSIFVGVLVGAGSMILHFSNGATILVQCPFEVYDRGTSDVGDGVCSLTAVILFKFLNERVVDVDVDVNGKITFEFGPGRGIHIIPSGSGFESYVLRTSKGVAPVY